MIFRPFRPYLLGLIATRGDALRFALRLPLAFIFRAFGALFQLLRQSRLEPILCRRWNQLVAASSIKTQILHPNLFYDSCLEPLNCRKCKLELKHCRKCRLETARLKIIVQLFWIVVAVADSLPGSRSIR